MNLTYKNNAKNIRRVVFFFIIIFLSIPISYSFLNSLDNESYKNITEIESNLKDFNPLISNCVNFDDIRNLLDDQKFVLLPRDIYLSESIKNISCLTKIVDIYLENESEEVILFFGRNNKVNLLYTISIAFIYIFSTFFKSHYFFILSSIIYQINLNILLTTLFLYFSFFLFLLLFNKKYFDQSLSRLSEKIESFNLKFPELNLSDRLDDKVSIILLFLGSIILGTQEYLSKSKYEYFNDELIVLLTSAKMEYLDLTSIESTIKHHTPFISQVFRFIFKISEFSDFLLGIVLVEIFFAFGTSVLLFITLNKINKNNLLSTLFSLGFLVFMSFQLLLNRQLAHFLYILIIYLLIKYIQKPRDFILFFILFISVLQIYNMETYALPISLLLLSIFIQIFKSFNMYLKTFIYGATSILIVYSKIFLNGEFYQLFMSNYYFHLFNTIRGSSIEKLLLAIGFSKSFSLKHIIFLVIFIRIIFILKTRKLSENYLETLFSFWFLGELLHVILSGPRSMHYGLVLVTPTVFLIYYYLSNAKNLKNSLILLSTIIFLFGNFSVTITGTVNLFSDNNQIKTADILDKKDKIEINSLLNNQDDPLPILTWVHPNDWNFVHLSTNTLPSTRYWYWFYMKYFPNENKYDWEGNWNENEIIRQWKSDLELEQPKHAIVDKNLDKYPYFFEAELESNYRKIFESEKWILYEKINPIN